jgi:hypothetical protein
MIFFAVFLLCNFAKIGTKGPFSCFNPRYLQGRIQGTLGGNLQLGAMVQEVLSEPSSLSLHHVEGEARAR